jgi:hypothetical protein
MKQLEMNFLIYLFFLFDFYRNGWAFSISAVEESIGGPFTFGEANRFLCGLLL